jgi:hypothetical protein
MQIAEVAGALAQIGAAFIDIAHQQIRDSHAGITGLRLIADQLDGVRWRVLADRLGGNHTGRAGANNYVVGHLNLQKRKRPWQTASLTNGAAYRARR